MTSISEIPAEILLGKHRLSPRQAECLTGQYVAETTTEDIIARIEIVKEFINISDLLFRNGINFIPLKGPVLSHRLYGEAILRNYIDLDILVNSADVTRVNSLLIEAGYISNPPGWPDNIKQQRILLKHTNHISLTNRFNQITVEVHWRLFKASLSQIRNIEEIILNNLVSLEFADRIYTVMSNELELLYLVIHGSIHYWKRLKWLADVVAFLKTLPVDNEKFTCLAVKLNCSRVCALCNKILSEYIPYKPQLPFTGKLPPRFIVSYSFKRLASEREKEHDNLPGLLRSDLYSLFLFPGIRYKLLVIRNTRLFVSEFFGRNRFFSIIPFFYFYGLWKLLMRRFSG